MVYSASIEKNYFHRLQAINALFDIYLYRMGIS